jgi:hypothetical protein
MPYPSAYARGQTTPETALEGALNQIPSGVGNGHTIRGTANDIGQIGAPLNPYAYSYTRVTFDGSDYLSNATTLGLAASDTYTVTVAFRATTLGTALIGMTTGIGSAVVLGTNSSGGLLFNSPSNGSTTGYLGGTTANGTIVAGVDYVVHLALRASSNTVNVFVNGVSIGPTAGAWLGTGNFPAPTAWAIGALVGGGTPHIGGIGLAWFDVGQYITTPASFFPPYALGSQLANPGARPAIGFGDAQAAAAWNAGTNLGDGTGTWTMTGSVT